MYPDYIVDEKLKKKNSKLDQEIQDISNEKHQRKQDEIHESFFPWLRFVGKYVESHDTKFLTKHEFIAITPLKFKKGSADYYDSRKSKKKIVFSFSKKEKVILVLDVYRGWPNIGKADVRHYILRVKNKTILDLSFAYTSLFNYHSMEKDIVYTYDLSCYDPGYSHYYQRIIQLINAIYEKENFEKQEKKDSLLAEEEINREFPNIKI